MVSAVQPLIVKDSHHIRNDCACIVANIPHLYCSIVIKTTRLVSSVAPLSSNSLLIASLENEVTARET